MENDVTTDETDPLKAILAELQAIREILQKQEYRARREAENHRMFSSARNYGG